jgi:hypothetical protein
MNRDGDHPPIGVDKLTMAALAVALFDEASGSQSANQFTPRHRLQYNLSLAY